MSRDLSSGAHSVFECVYHIGWCPKYRFNVLRKESSKADMEAILRETAAEHGMRIDELAVMPDHTQTCACDTARGISGRQAAAI